MPMLQLKLLGVPEIMLNGRQVKFARRGSIGLLAYLALSGHAHARESLAALLAGDSAEEQARKHLSNMLIDVRQHIGDYVTATRQSVSFARRLPHRLDVVDFQLRIADRPEDDSTASLDDAIALYRDEFLAGLALPGAPEFEAWLYAQREELRGQYVLALKARMEASMRCSAWETGIPAARRLIVEEPWMEEAHRELMLMLARSGQRHAAISHYHGCRRVLREELGVEPQAETTALYNRLRAADVRPPHNLPSPSTPLVGRMEEVHLLRELVADPGCRLASVVGLGGSGKTRLAMEVGRMYAQPTVLPPEQPFPDGVMFVPLAELAPPSTDEELPRAEAESRILAAIEAALEIPASAESSRDRIHAYLRSKAMLLILDNLEHVLAGSDVLSQLLAQAPHLTLVVTSRVPMHMPDERVLLLDGLRAPRDVDELETADASALFLTEARRVHLGFQLSADERPALVELCQAVGGFPLALILAARWVSLLTCSQILAELGRGLEVLTTNEPDLPERHRSVARVLERAMSRLTSQDRVLAQFLAAPGRNADFSPGDLSPDLLQRVKPLREQALLSTTGAHGELRLHPLLQRYVELRDTQPTPVCAA